MKSLPIRAIAVATGAILSLFLAVAPAAAQTMVRLHTTQGPLDMKLLDGEAPITVANFLAYVRDGSYASSMIHRSARNPNTTPFVIQGGGFIWPEGSLSCCNVVTSKGAILNEFSATRSNIRGTVAMAKVTGQPNSATSQWFLNMGDNSFLDTNNGGFTVFARLTTPGLELADRIAAFPRLTYLNPPFAELPVTSGRTSGNPARSEVILITAATEVPPPATIHDRIFNYLEAKYPTYLAPVASSSGEAFGFQFRHYAQYDVYLAVGFGHVGYLAPSVSPDGVDIGPVEYWNDVSINEGY